jgi:hypothetical protein
MSEMRREIERKLAYLNRCKNIFLKYFQDGKLPGLSREVMCFPPQSNTIDIHVVIPQTYVMGKAAEKVITL